MSAHTPAPWKLQDRGDRWSIAGPDGAGLAACTGNVRRPEAEKSANARLIAAAPELLDALRRAERVMTDADLDHEPADDEARLTLDAVRAAIAKAEATP